MSGAGDVGIPFHPVISFASLALIAPTVGISRSFARWRNHRILDGQSRLPHPSKNRDGYRISPSSGGEKSGIRPCFSDHGTAPRQIRQDRSGRVS